MIMTGSHDTLLVVLSIVVAMVASYTALDLAGRVRASEGLLQRIWLGAAAVAMGGGIWAMHFVAMLAFTVPGMEVTYDIGLTLVSLGVAIIATGVSFAIMCRSSDSWPLLAAAGVLMGFGVVAMHYVGMAAMRMPATLRYDRLWFALSVLIAIGAATAALWLASRDRHSTHRVFAAIVMGVAIAGMHFAGMRAALFTMAPEVDVAKAASSVGQAALAFAVSTAALLILFLALIAAMFDRRFAALAHREAQALRASEERFRSLYRGTPLPLHSLDREGRIEQVSNNWLELMGYAREEVEGKPFHTFLANESAAGFVETDWPTLIRDDSLPPREHRVVTHAGDFRDVVVSAKVERDERGAFLHVLGGLTDITQRKRTEDVLRQTQKIEAIGQLTGGVAHDFNNLLAVVVGNLELLRKRMPEDATLSRLVESALEGAQRGASLTQRLLAFARRQDLRPTRVDVPDLVRGMTDLLRRSLGPQIRVETHFPLGLAPVRVDANQLEMSILNIAVNARDAMPDGGTLDISADEAVLADLSDDERAAHELAGSRFVRLTLADTGTGMDERTLERAVDPFFTTKGLGKGTGLGLSMVQGLAAQSGGRLVLRSTPGAGTVVELFLPVAEAVPASAEPRTEPADEGEAGPARTILVVDDDSLVLANVVAMLEDLGHTAVPAASGEDALRQLSSGCAADLLLTDQLMPGITGTQLMRRARQRRPTMPMLLMSGFSEFTESESEAVTRLSKPFTQLQLATAIRRAATATPAIPLHKPA